MNQCFGGRDGTRAVAGGLGLSTEPRPRRWNGICAQESTRKHRLTHPHNTHTHTHTHNTHTHTAERALLRRTYIPWAVRTGGTAQPLMNVWYERSFARDLEEMRRELRITPAPPLPPLRKG